VSKAAAATLLLAIVAGSQILAGCAHKRYSGHGLVLEVNRPDRTVVVSHDAIRGYMEPMVMPFRVGDARLLAEVKRGDRVRFRLAVGRKGSYLDRLAVESAPPADPADWQSPVTSRILTPGEPVPDFELTDQNGRSVSIARLRGRVIAINFIYTRCPLPDYCPRMTGMFAALSTRFAARLEQDLVLLSVSFDPGFDTSEVLNRYAKSSGANRSGWHFLTGTKEEIGRVCGFFGVGYWPDEGSITHNLQTGLIDRDGRLAASVEGNAYSARQLGDLVALLLQR
jgi:protein SCO1/2